MSSPHDDAPLATGSLAGSEEALLAPARQRGGSNSRALKIAGLTTLACLLLASQVFTAYMVFDQKQQIHTLQKNSERMGKQITRSSQVSPMRMAMPMSSLPLMTDFTEEDTKETPLTKLEDIAVVSVEKQLMDLVENMTLPQFNDTFLANLQSLRQRTDKSEWRNFQSWLRFWLIFQMAQQKPAAPTPQTAFLIKTPCQVAASSESRKVGTYKPQCDEQGRYKPMQCWHATGFCWCVDESGNPIQGTSIRGHPDCRRGAGYARIMASPMLMQKTYSEDDK